MIGSSTNAQGWKTISIPTSEKLTAVFFTDSDTGYVSGSEGKIYRTFDQGRTWESFPIAPGVTIEDVYFHNADTGFACGRRGSIFVTYDAGYNWINKSLSDTLPWFFDIEMFDRNNGLVIGATREPEKPMNGISLRTTDGGKSWSKMPPIGMGLSEIAAIPGKSALFTSFGRLNTSTDNGKTWSTRVTHNGSPARTLSIKGKTGLIAGPNGMVHFSSDTGNSWYVSEQDYNKVFVTSVLVDEQVGYLGGVNTAVMKTEDGGRSWTEESGTKDLVIFDMCVTDKNVWAVGPNGVVISKSL
ncbi:MAG: YCF48-related protein, partial [bacterium]|nr:YCF48-related protein [bacterium]